VVRKKLSPSGAKDTEGNYNNAHLNLHRDELEAAGMDIGDEVFVHVRENMIVAQKAGQDDIRHDFGLE